MEATFAQETLEPFRAAGIWVAAGSSVGIESYEAAQYAGTLRLFTVRVAEKPVGYAAYLVGRNPHYRSSLQAVQDSFFVRPEHAPLRGDLLRFAHQRLRDEGVQTVYQKQLDMRPLLERLGYEPVDTIWSKGFDGS